MNLWYFRTGKLMSVTAWNILVNYSCLPNYERSNLQFFRKIFISYSLAKFYVVSKCFVNLCRNYGMLAAAKSDAVLFCVFRFNTTNGYSSTESAE